MNKYLHVVYDDFVSLFNWKVLVDIIGSLLAMLLMAVSCISIIAVFVTGMYGVWMWHLGGKYLILGVSACWAGVGFTAYIISVKKRARGK
jgi:hypothetical protein